MYDYIIIGGGSAGCVLAGRLSEDLGVSVCLLEAGGVDSSVLIHCPGGLPLLAKQPGEKGANWRFDTVPQAGMNGRVGYQPRGKVLGGSSSINAMIYIRGQRQDYDDWAAAGNPGWAWADVLPYFKRSEHNERGADAWHGSGGPLNVMDLRSPNHYNPLFVQAAQQAGYPLNTDFNGATQEGVGAYQVTHKNGERFSAAKAYLTPHLGRPNLKVITGAQTTRVLLEGKCAVGVEARIGGQLQQLKATREVIVSAGALQSPQVLMLSGIGPGAQLQQFGIPVVQDSPGVGRQLHDHFDAIVCHEAPGQTELFGLSLGFAFKAIGGIREWRRSRSGMLTTNFAEAGGFIRSAPEETRPDLQLHFVIAKLADHGRKTQFGHGWSCHVCVLRPKSRGSVGLSSPDPLAAPRIDPNFLGDRDDVTRMVRGVKLMRSILGQPALAQRSGKEQAHSAAAISDEQIEQYIRATGDTIYHPVGSCRMGLAATDPLDHELRVKGVSGLRVVDASVMPQIVSGNTNAPTIMIAERAADLIKAAARPATVTSSAPVRQDEAVSS
jgi:choline dehydrogenase-like flavoprotein